MTKPSYKQLAMAVMYCLPAAFAGCATQPSGQAADAPAAELQAKGATEAVPVTGMGASGVARSEAVGTDAGKKADDGKAEDKKKAAESTMKLIPGNGVFVKPATTLAVSAGPQDVVLNFEGADLREVVRVVLGDMLHENYAIDPKVNGTVTIHTSQALTRAAVIPILETVLRMNNAAMVREDGAYRIVPLASAARSATPQLGNLQPGYSVQVVPLQYIAAREMSKILEPLLPEGSIIRVDETRNLLMLAGGEGEMRHALETVSVFDLDWLAGMSVGLFNLQSVDVKSILPELELLFGEKSKGPFAGMVRVIPIERMNAVFVVTPRPQYLEQARVWVERLDRNGGKSGTRLFVYHVQNGKAEKIAALLSQVIGGKSASGTTPAASVAPGLTGTSLQSGSVQSGAGAMASGSSPFGSSMSSSSSSGALGTASLPNAPTTTQSVVATGTGEALGLGAGSTIKVIADRDNNALLILANAAEYEKIEDAVKRLDVVPRQVLVEVTIAEVTLDGVLQYGLEWYFNNATNLTGQLTNLGALAPVPSAVTPKAPFTAIWSGPGGNTKAVLSALAKKDKLNVLSSPHIMVTDNQVAQIKVGDSVPIQGQSTYASGVVNTTAIVTSVQYVDTGILLEVRPHINAGGLVTMEINQEVSEVTQETSSNINSPRISKRMAKSIVSVQSGETMVLAGLIKEKKVDNRDGLPLLSEIPVFGALFGTQNRENHRTELVIMITPKVVNDNQQAREVTAEFRKKLSGFGKINPDAAGLEKTVEKNGAEVVKAE